MDWKIHKQTHKYTKTKGKDMIALPNWENIKTLLININFVLLYSYAFPLCPIVFLFNILMLQILTKKRNERTATCLQGWKETQQEERYGTLFFFFYIVCFLSLIKELRDFSSAFKNPLHCSPSSVRVCRSSEYSYLRTCIYEEISVYLSILFESCTFIYLSICPVDMHV